MQKTRVKSRRKYYMKKFTIFKDNCSSLPNFAIVKQMSQSGGSNYEELAIENAQLTIKTQELE